jgi:hypothetical protein
MYELDDFERALAHFGTRVEIIIALELGGKLDADTAYKNIKMELKELKKVRKKHTRTCSKCEATLPLDAEHFQVVKSFREGFSFYCNECNKPKPRED